jgi:2-polyprenyl-3-methyl-5-hydroxy-6-metoxy-1,4-benzoquinol methylase
MQVEMSPHRENGMKTYERQVAKCYSTWGKDYYKNYYGKNAPYPPVHLAHIRDVVDQHGSKTVLDAGCGPASTLRNLFGRGLELFGFDLTPEMVMEARRIFKKEGLDPERIWEGSVLDRKAFQRGNRSVKFDAILSWGVMPHLKEPDERKVIQNFRAALRPGGMACVEARNELFALFTLNRFSKDLIWDRLMNGERLLKSAGRHRSHLARAAQEFFGHFHLDQPPMRRGKAGEPGYDEVTSRAHNPFELRQKFLDCGFKSVDVRFYHFHAMPPVMGAAVPTVFRAESVKMEDPSDWRGYIMASAFYLVAVA